MQLELSEKDALEEQLAKLRDSIDASGDLSSGRQGPNTNKLRRIECRQARSRSG